MNVPLNKTTFLLKQEDSTSMLASQSRVEFVHAFSAFGVSARLVGC